jgi:XRE family transcriptional regulator of biofilm formation
MIGQKIYELRKKRGFTLTELAAHTKISKSYLSNIERNIYKNPSIQIVKKIAQVLEVDLKILLNTDLIEETHKIPDTEIIELAQELKNSGISKKQFSEYKLLLEFIKWQNQSEENK